MEGTVNNGFVPNESHEEKKFAGVIFHNIQETYLPGKDIRCCYSIKPYVLTTANDWIGLYKVGWQSPKEYVCYAYSPVLENPTDLTASLSAQNSVVFRGDSLPSEEFEFYQFCYVTSSSEIRGASYPFQISFSKPGELEICSEEDDDTLLIVNNRTTHLENSLAKAFDENAALKASKEKTEADVLKFQDMILSLEANKADLASENGKQKKMLERAISEKTDFEEKYKEAAEQLKCTQTALKLANGKTTEIQQQLANERAQHVQKTSEQQKFEEERQHFLEVISHKDDVIQNFFNTVEENSGKTAALESEIGKLKSKNDALQGNYDGLVLEKAKGDESLQKSKQALVALEKSQAEHCEQVGILQTENSMMKEELGVIRGQMEEMSDSFSNQQSLMEQKHLKECGEFENQILVINKALSECKQQLVGSKEEHQEVLLLLDNERKKNQDVIHGYEDSIVKMLDQLKQERDFNNSLSSASDRQVAELQEQLNVQLQKNASALKQTEGQTQEIKRLEENIQLNETEIERLRKEIDEQAQQLETVDKRENESLQSNGASNGDSEKPSTFEGSYFALKTAHDRLRKQLLEAKKDRDNLSRQKADLKRQLATVQLELPDSDLRFEMANLKKQIEDLRIRLNMGAEAYKAKFKECQKFEKQLKKIRKDSSGRSTPQSPSSATDFEIRNLKQSLENEKTTSAALKKSLENYKTDAHEAKEQLLKVNNNIILTIGSFQTTYTPTILTCGNLFSLLHPLNAILCLL
jgi:chromosome segregation ATPase